jgi:N-acetylmuramic acid 6-phosphate etherase
MSDHRGEDASLVGLASEGRHAASYDLDRLSALEIVQLMNAEDHTVAAAVERELPQVARAVTGIAQRLRAGGRLIYMGAGTSGRLAAMDAAECPPTFNVPADLVSACVAGGPMALESALEDAEDRADLGAADLGRREVSARDAVVGISASGRTPYVIGAVSLARERGALTIGLACNAGTPLADMVDVMIAPVVGPEIIAGSTRLKAGTATKLVLNTLTTAAMTQLGRVYGNRMVDLQPGSAKLRERALRLIAEVAGVSRQRAARAFDVSKGRVKIAIVIARSGCDATEASRALRAASGSLRIVLQKFRRK